MARRSNVFWSIVLLTLYAGCAQGYSRKADATHAPSLSRLTARDKTGTTGGQLPGPVSQVPFRKGLTDVSSFGAEREGFCFRSAQVAYRKGGYGHKALRVLAL